MRPATSWRPSAAPKLVLMAQLRFTKAQGTGNDFVLFADPEGTQALTPEQIRALCDRRFGVGADGVVRVVPSRLVPEAAPLLEQAPEAEWFMDYQNADGSPAEMCGNGIRAFAQFALNEGLVQLAAGQTLVAGTRNGPVALQRSGSGFSADLGRWRLLSDEVTVHAHGLDVPRPSIGISTGNPHRVVILASLAELDGLDLRQPVWFTPEVPEGANVEFVVPADPLVRDAVGQIRMRVYERGSGETLSCGTGAVAAALAARHLAGPTAPSHWRVDVPGGTLAVRMFATEEGEHVALAGSAVLTYTGEVNLDALTHRG